MENPIAKLALNYWYKVLIAGGFFVFLVNGTGILTAYPTAGTGLISLTPSASATALCDP